MLMNLNATGDDGWSFERVMVYGVRRTYRRRILRQAHTQRHH